MNFCPTCRGEGDTCHDSPTQAQKQTAATECAFKQISHQTAQDIHELSSEEEDNLKAYNTWLNIGSVKLTSLDKKTLTCGQWLIDRHIHAAMILMKDLFPLSGLQDPVLGETLSFQVCGDEMVQVLHSGGSHWITISTVGTSYPEVNVYDSLQLYPTLPFQTKEQICSLIRCKEEKFILKYANVQVNNLKIIYISRSIIKLYT